MTEALKPCPFCGGLPDIGVLPETAETPRGYFCKCPACLAETATDGDRAMALRLWNRRVALPELSGVGAREGWLTLQAERVLYLDDGRERVLCDRIPSPATLVVKLAALSEVPGVGWTEPNSGHVYSAAELAELLNGRDSFIVKNGLWDAFVSEVPGEGDGEGGSAQSQPVSESVPLSAREAEPSAAWDLLERAELALMQAVNRYQSIENHRREPERFKVPQVAAAHEEAERVLCAIASARRRLAGEPSLSPAPETPRQAGGEGL